MTSCNQLKDNFLLIFIHLIIEYFVTEKFDLSIGIYISMKSAFFYLIQEAFVKLRENGRNVKICLAKTKQKD